MKKHNIVKGFYVEFQITPVEWYETEVITRIDDTENDWACVLASDETEAEAKVYAYLKSLDCYYSKEIPGGVITYFFDVTEVVPNIEFNRDLTPNILVIE